MLRIFLGAALLVVVAAYSSFLQDVLSGGLGTLLGVYLIGEITYVKPDAGSARYKREEQIRTSVRTRFVALSSYGYGIPLLAHVSKILTRLLLRVRGDE